MSQVRSQHPNARLTPRHRRNMVDCVLLRGWPVAAAAERFQVDPKTVRKWVRRFEAEGETGLWDRSSRPRTSPGRTPGAVRAVVVELRRRRRWGADHIAHEVGLAASTVQAVLRAEGLGRLERGDRCALPVVRYVRDRPGELVHVDVKKIAAIPPGGGWRVHGRGNAPPARRSTTGYRFIHTAIDDRTRLAYSEVLDDEQAATAAGFWGRAAAWFAARGITCERVLTDNGSCYRSTKWHQACAATATSVKKTRPRRPQTNTHTGWVPSWRRI